MNCLVIDAFNLVMANGSILYPSLKNDAVGYSKALSHMLRVSIRKLSSTFEGHRLFAVWDSYGGTDWRREKYPSYKCNRHLEKEDYDSVRAYMEVFEDEGVLNISIPQTEADDVIFSLCKSLKNDGNEVVICSRDRDMIQIVQCGYADGIWDNSKKSYVTIPQYNIVDFKALKGDSSDSIIGVKGIGDKTAIRILNGEKTLTESQIAEFELCKDIIDATRHPRFNENCEYLRNVYGV